MAFGLIRTIVGAWNAGRHGSGREPHDHPAIGCHSFFDSPAYRNEIARSGVTAVSWANWFGGVYGDANDFKNFWPRFAVDPETYFSLYPEFQLPPDQLAASRRSAAPASSAQAGPAARLQAR